MTVKWHPCEYVYDEETDTGEWIGLPNKAGEYLVTVKPKRESLFVEIVEFYSKSDRRLDPASAWDSFWGMDVIAWAEVPEPYRVKKGKKK